MKPLVIIAFVTAPPGREDELAQELGLLVPPTQEEPGCLAFRAYQHPAIINRFVVYEEFADQAAIDAHLRFDYTQRFIDWIKASGTTVSFEFWNALG